jgi:lysophospholipid acyltransferase (LPLAT)-like uncharacterized protein
MGGHGEMTAQKGELPGPLVGGPKPREVRTSRRPSKLRRRFYGVVAPVAVALMRSLWWTYRYSIDGEEPIRERVKRGEPLILTFWHHDIFVMAWYLERLNRMGARVTFLVSPSEDGELVMRVLGIMDQEAVRGSATRSGVKAMHGLYRAIVSDGGSPVVLPDGPQGPRHHCKPGSLLLARMSGARILPMACASRPFWRIRTWDRLLLPPPFARVRIILGESFTVSKELDSDELELERQRLEATLNELSATARHQAKR